MRLKKLTLILALASATALLAQPGAIDPTFNPTDLGFGSGDGANDFVRSTAVQADGKIIIGGSFTSYNGTPRNGIARLNANGSLDSGFNPGTGANSSIYSTAVQADGKIIIGGYFTSYNGTGRNSIARLNADGSLDTGFDPGTGAAVGTGASCIYSTAVQADGKIIIGGDFTSYNGTVRNYIARLNADGSLDTGFDPGTGAAGETWPSFVRSTAVQADGKIIIGGYFTSYNGTGRNHIARLNADGSLDTGFDPGTGATGANSNISSTAVQADGKVIIGGFFTSYNGTGRNSIARLNADGSLDTGFDPGTGANSFIWSTAVQSDGKIIIGGEFTSYNGTVRTRIARLNADGSLDTGFDPGTGANSTIYPTAVQADGRILIGGAFTSCNGTVRTRIARLNTDGSLDSGFNPGSGANSTVNSMAMQPDGRILIGGAFTSYNDIPRNHIARLNADGSLDTGFDPGTGVSGVSSPGIYSFALQPDGKILIGGYFTSYNGTGRNHIARLNADGTLDPGFNIGTGANSWIYSVTLQPDGKILIGGVFSSYNGTARNRIARLNADGSLDTSFDPGTGANNYVYSVVLQPDGRVLVGGEFSSYNSTSRNRIARLNADGSLDPGFDPGTGASSGVYTVAIQLDGKILIGGNYTSYNGIPRNRIARLNADGSLDTGFDPGSGANSGVRSMVLGPDGKLLIAGSFTSYNGTTRNRIARLNADGSLDNGFNPVTGPMGGLYPEILCIALQADAKILVGGVFTSYNGTGRNRIARVLGGEPYVTAIVKVHLQGPYSTSTKRMQNSLWTNGLVPLTEPYTALGYTYVNGGAQTLDPGAPAFTGSFPIVDWVVLELRDPPANVVAARAGVVRTDGSVFTPNGDGDFTFQVPPGNYHVAVRHRNHLGAMTATTLPLGPLAAIVDLTLPTTATYGTDACKSMVNDDATQTMVLWAGDVNFDDAVLYTGEDNDRDAILSAIGGVVPTNFITGYHNEDVNLDGTVYYTGEDNDRDIILQNIGGVVPTNVREGTVP